MKKRILAATLFVAFSLGNALAQTAEIPNVMKLRSATSNGVVKKQNELVGYYTFFFKEKADKKNSAYEVRVVDNELNDVNTFEIIRPKASILMEAVFNGDVIMFFFYDAKTGYEFVTYKLDGTKVGSSQIGKKEIAKFDIMATQNAVTNSADNATLFPVEGEGFVRQTFTKNKKQAFELTYYDSKAKSGWSYSSPEDSKLIELLDVNEVTEKYVTATIYRKKNVMTNKVNLAFLILDTKTGKKIAELPMGNEDDGKKSVAKSFVDTDNKKIVLIGEYYKSGDDIYKDKSQGLYVMDVSFKGDIMGETQYGWKSDISKFMKETLDEEDKKDDRPYNLYIHDVIRSSNGHLHLVAEQYKKQISATAVAGKALAAATGGSSNASSFEVLVSNMVHLELDAQNKLEDIDIVQKRKRHVLLPEGYGLVSIVKLGHIIKAEGEFDYSYTSRDKNADQFTVIYTDANRKEEKGKAKSDVMVGVIHVANGEVKTDRVGLDFNSRFFWLRQAKPGQILVGEYFRKEKVVKLRMEQLVY